jgi:hypothetical protein
LQFFVDDTARFDVAAVEAMLAFPQYEFGTLALPDPHWIFYEVLLPPQLTDQKVANARWLWNQRRLGDQPERTRVIDHRMIFRDPNNCNKFIDYIRSHGFAVRDDFPLLDGGLVVLEFWRIDKPLEISRVNLHIVDTAMDLGGRYDGWGCDVVSA